jgi:integrase
VTRLTKRSVDAAKPGAKIGYVWDGEIRGLCLRVMPSGIKSFCLLYRNEFGRQRWLTIGRYGEITPDEARAKAIELRGMVAKREDPQQEKIDRRKSISLGELLDRYEREYLEVHNRASTATEFKRLLRNHVRPLLGSRKAKDISAADILELVGKMRETPRSANLARAILSKVFNLAEEWGLRPKGSNPCDGVKKYEEKAHDRTLSAKELAALGAALDAAGTSELPACLDAIRLLTLSGCRLSEVTGLRRDQVEIDKSLLRLPKTKTKPRAHVLGRPAVALLKRVLTLHDSDWVFPEPSGEAGLSKSRIEKCWQRIRKSAGIEDVRIHDLRHHVGTVAGRIAPNAFLVRDKLGHASTGMTGRYVHAETSPLEDLSTKVENEIGAALGLGKVVPLKGDR